MVDLQEALARLTGERGWEPFDGPQSGTGIDYWFRRGQKQAYINYDQEWVTIEVDGVDIFSGYERVLIDLTDMEDK